MERFPTTKKVLYDAVLVEIAGLKQLSRHHHCNSFRWYFWWFVQSKQKRLLSRSILLPSASVRSIFHSFWDQTGEFFCYCSMTILRLLTGISFLNCRLGKSSKIWETGGIVDLTEISDNCYNTSTASVCFSLGGLRWIEFTCIGFNVFLLNFSATLITGMARHWLFPDPLWLPGFCQRWIPMWISMEWIFFLHFRNVTLFIDRYVRTMQLMNTNPLSQEHLSSSSWQKFIAASAMRFQAARPRRVLRLSRFRMVILFNSTTMLCHQELHSAVPS